MLWGTDRQHVERELRGLKVESRGLCGMTHERGIKGKSDQWTIRTVFHQREPQEWKQRS